MAARIRPEASRRWCVSSRRAKRSGWRFTVSSKKHTKKTVAIVMGSDSDLPVMKDAATALDELGVPYEMSVISAHRTPSEMAEFATRARRRGVRVVIAGAGGAAHLPGMVAAYTELPV